MCTISGEFNSLYSSNQAWADRYEFLGSTIRITEAAALPLQEVQQILPTRDRSWN